LLLIYVYCFLLLLLLLFDRCLYVLKHHHTITYFKPFDSRSEAVVIRKIQRADFNFKAHIWNSLSDEAKKFIKSLLKVEPSERLEATVRVVVVVVPYLSHLIVDVYFSRLCV
jgi:hypothetical protein